MANAAPLQFYKAKLERALEDLGVQMFNHADVPGLKEDIEALYASLQDPEAIEWYEIHKNVGAQWNLGEQRGTTALNGLTINWLGTQMRIAHNQELPALLWVTVVVQNARSQKRRHYIRFAMKGRDALVWAPWMDKFVSPEAKLGIKASIIPLQLSQLKSKVDNITDLALKIETVNLDGGCSTDARMDSLFSTVASMAEHLKTLRAGMDAMQQSLTHLNTGNALNSAATQLTERILNLERKEGQSQEAMMRHTAAIQHFLQVTKAEQPSFVEDPTRPTVLSAIGDAKMNGGEPGP